MMAEIEAVVAASTVEDMVEPDDFDYAIDVSLADTLDEDDFGSDDEEIYELDGGVQKRALEMTLREHWCHVKEPELDDPEWKDLAVQDIPPIFYSPWYQKRSFP